MNRNMETTSTKVAYTVVMSVNRAPDAIWEVEFDPTLKGEGDRFGPYYMARGVRTLWVSPTYKPHESNLRWHRISVKDVCFTQEQVRDKFQKALSAHIEYETWLLGGAGLAIQFHQKKVAELMLEEARIQQVIDGARVQTFPEEAFSLVDG